MLFKLRPNFRNLQRFLITKTLKSVTYQQTKYQKDLHGCVFKKAFHYLRFSLFSPVKIPVIFRYNLISVANL